MSYRSCTSKTSFKVAQKKLLGIKRRQFGLRFLQLRLFRQFWQRNVLFWRRLLFYYRRLFLRQIDPPVGPHRRPAALYFFS